MSKLKSWLLAVVAFAALALPASAQADPGLGSLRLNGTHVAYVALISTTKKGDPNEYRASQACIRDDRTWRQGRGHRPQRPSW